MSYVVKNKDCLQYIEELKTKYSKPFIDAIITDPPYNISRANNFKTIKRNGIDFGNWDYGFDQSTWIKNVVPLIKDGGTIIIFNDYKNFGEISKTLEELDFKIKDLLRWVKNNPMPRNTNRRYVTDYELAIWAVKGKGKWTFNKDKKTPYLRPEFKHSIVANGKNKIHPTQKSEKLIKDIISIHTDKGDIIYDPFMGSASVGIAAIELNRIFIGTEIDEKYFKKAAIRLSETHCQNIENKRVNRSPLYYLGDKYKILSQIYSYFPDKINHFYDLFGGGGTVIANVLAKKYFYNDVDKNIVNLIKFLKNHSFKEIIIKVRNIIKEYQLSYWKNENGKQKNKVKYNQLKKKYNQMKIKSDDNAIVHLLVLIIYGFNSQIRFNSKGHFNIPVGKQDLNKNRELILKTFINSIKEKEIVFENKSFEQYLSNNYKKNDFIYLDPPYSITSATYNLIWDAKKDQLLFDFLDELNEKNVKWAMSNVTKSGSRINKKLIDWSKKFNVYYLDHNYNNSNYQKIEKGAEEVLITNYVK